MSRNKEAKAKMDQHGRMMEYCRDCIARLKKMSGSLEAAIEACLEYSIKKYIPKRTAEIVK